MCGHLLFILTWLVVASYGASQWAYLRIYNKLTCVGRRAECWESESWLLHRVRPVKHVCVSCSVLMHAGVMFGHVWNSSSNRVPVWRQWWKKNRRPERQLGKSWTSLVCWERRWRQPLPVIGSVVFAHSSPLLFVWYIVIDLFVIWFVLTIVILCRSSEVQAQWKGGWVLPTYLCRLGLRLGFILSVFLYDSCIYLYFCIGHFACNIMLM